MPQVIGRLITAMVTPFDSKGEVNYDQAQRLATALVQSGSDGIVVSGTTGESPTLTKDEKIRLFKEVKAAVGHRASVIAGAGSNSTMASVELTKAAEAAGADAILLVVPYYNKPTQDGLFQHFKTIAGSTKLPVILYNVPGRTVTNLAVETVARLTIVRNIVGIKEASGNLDQIAAIIKAVPKGFEVWSGNDTDTYPILELGGYGVISVTSHVVGLQMKEMIDRFVKGNRAEARAIHERLMPVFKDLFVVSNPIPVKYALNKAGFNVGGYRLPLTPPDAKAAAVIDATMAKIKVDLPIPAKP